MNCYAILNLWITFSTCDLFLNLKVLNLNLNRCLVCSEFKTGLWITAFEFKFQK